MTIKILIETLNEAVAAGEYLEALSDDPEDVDCCISKEMARSIAKTLERLVEFAEKCEV